MLLELARQYADIIQAMEVERFRSVGASYEFRALITLHDGSQLFVKDSLFVDGTRKYAYHWQDRAGRLRCRWDNAPHWPEVASYPHHHLRREEPIAQEQAEAAIRLATEQGYAEVLRLATCLRGAAVAAQGRAAEGITQMHQGLDLTRAVGNRLALRTLSQ